MQQFDQVRCQLVMVMYQLKYTLIAGTLYSLRIILIITGEIPPLADRNLRLTPLTKIAYVMGLPIQLISLSIIHFVCTQNLFWMSYVSILAIKQCRSNNKTSPNFFQEQAMLQRFLNELISS